MHSAEKLENDSQYGSGNFEIWGNMAKMTTMFKIHTEEGKGYLNICEITPETGMTISPKPA